MLFNVFIDTIMPELESNVFERLNKVTKIAKLNYKVGHVNDPLGKVIVLNSVIQCVH